MKESIRRWLGLAIVPLTLLMLGASPAFAQNETHKCDGDPNFPFLDEVFTRDENNPENGPIIVRRTDGQDCVISAADIHAANQIDIRVEGGGKLIIPDAVNIRSLGGNVTLVSTGNDISAPNADIKADNLIDIQAGVADGTLAGSIETKDIISNYRDVLVGDANILIRAQSGLNVGKVKTNGDLGVNSQRSGNVQIDANLHPSNTGDISIGAGGNIEEIDIRSQTGGTDQNGNPSPFKAEIGLRVENGSDNSTGNITVSDLGVIKVTQAQSRSGRLELNANKGELILGSGTLDASQADFGGGNIYLFGEKITFNGAATIDNGQSDTAPKTARQIIIAASEIDYSAGNLEIFSDGSGLSDAAPATVYFLPAGGIISTSTNNVLSLEHTVQFNGSFFFFPGEVHFNGGAGSDLDLRADGEHIQVAITGDNIVFDGKDVTVQARGKNHTKHEIVMGFFDFGSYDGTKGLQMNNTGVTLFNVRGFGGPNNSGGDIQIQVDKSDLNLGRLNLRANAGANGSDGGTILYTTSEMILSTNTLVDFQADAANNTVGNAQILRPSNGRKAIFLNAGQSDLILGRNKEKIQFSANGGGQGGNGGAIEVVSTGQILLDRSDAVEAKVRGPNGQGGQIKVDAGTLAFSNPNGVEINVDGGMTSGNGGVIELLADGGSVDIDPSSSGVKVSAKAPGEGNGGLVFIDGVADLNIDGANINVSASGDNGAGGAILVGNGNNVIVSGTLQADGSGNGDGGLIRLQSNTKTDTTGAILVANGGELSGSGGTIELDSQTVEFDGVLASSTEGVCVAAVAAQTSAQSLLAGQSNGGTFTVIADNVDTDWSAISGVSLNGCSTGKGGTFTVTNTNPIDLSGLGSDVILTKGGPDGLGGEVYFQNVSNHTPDLPGDLIDVSGSSLLSETENGGRIGLNNVICQRRVMPQTAVGPSDYWDCTNVTNMPQASAVLNSFAPENKLALKNAKIRLYGFSDPTAAVKYLGPSNVNMVHASNLGFTRHRPVPGPEGIRHYSVVYTNIPGSNSLAEIQGAVRHEAGHQLDYYHQFLSKSAYFKELVQQDWNWFNNIDTCVLWPNPAGQPPVCDANGTVLAPYANHTNQQILDGEVGNVGIPLTLGVASGDQWEEIFVEQFAISGGGGINSVLDAWLTDYFHCSRYYVETVYAGGKDAPVVQPWPPFGCSTPSAPKP